LKSQLKSATRTSQTEVYVTSGLDFLELFSDSRAGAKKIFRSVPEGERMVDFEGLFDKMRHRQSDKFRRPDRIPETYCLTGSEFKLQLASVAHCDCPSNLTQQFCLKTNSPMKCSKDGSPKNAGSRSLLTGSWFGGIKLKDRSAGGWRSGLQRSEK
jgi:hypothetical protein